jgi:isocitrate dehydrogenase kinase/phosphatase
MTEKIGLQVAQIILQGFKEYFAEFHEITLDARQRFIKAEWKSCQQATKDRLNMYLDKILIIQSQVQGACGDRVYDKQVWSEAKAAYSQLVENFSNYEIAETFFNSIYCKVFDHKHIDNQYLFVLPTDNRPQRSKKLDLSIFNFYHSGGNIKQVLHDILDDYDLGLPYENKEQDTENMYGLILKELPSDIIRNIKAYTVIHKSVFFRSQTAYLIGKVVSNEVAIPFVVPILQNGKREIFVDTVIFDPDQLSIIFSFTRAYFKVDAPVPFEIVRFLHDLMPLKTPSELYNSIGFNRHGKTKFYREFLAHLEKSDDQFVSAAGIKGMVMSVFTLPSYDIVFKVIKDRFTPPKEVTSHIVKEKYMLVSRHDKAGRMADTQQYANFLFPKDRFSDDCLAELIKVAPSTVEVQDDHVLIKHLYTERRMIPLNIYLETADENELRAAIYEYGNAIKELAAANIFPGDMLFKNFGVTRHKRVVFYDYDEIVPLTDCNFRVIPEASTPEQEMAKEPWYSVGENDIFPEEFRFFLLSSPKLRKVFEEFHSDIFDARYWQGIQQAILDGKVMDVPPYPEKIRFKRR